MRFNRNHSFLAKQALLKRIFILSIFPVFLLMGGCGTVSRQALVVETEPEGAYAYINGRFVGQTPLSQRVNRQVPHKVELRMVGFRTREVNVFPVNREAQRFLVVGPLEESGYYRDLRPNPVVVEMPYAGIPVGTTILSSDEQDALLVRIADEETNGELTSEQAAVARRQVLQLGTEREENE